MKTTARVALAALLFSAIVTLSSAAAGTWAQLYSTDPAVFAANLRAAGCPEATIGLLLSQEINAQFADKERALQPTTASAEGLRNFWAPERREAWLQLQKEKNDTLRRVLGTAPDQRARTDWVASWFPHLAAESRDVVRRVTEDYDQLVQQVMTVARGSLLDEDREMLLFLESEREKDLVAVLTADEVIDYQIKRSRFGAYLRTTLEAFEPTPPEMRVCYELGVKHGLSVEMINSNPDRQLEIKQAIEGDLAKLWTPERLADYQRAQSMYYRRTFNLVRRLELGRDVANRIFDSQVAMGEEAMRLMRARPRTMIVAGPADGSTTPPARPNVEAMTTQLRTQRVEELNRLLDQHTALVLTLLGDAGLKAYYETHQMWIDRMRQGVVVGFTPGGMRVNRMTGP